MVGKPLRVSIRALSHTQLRLTEKMHAPVNEHVSEPSTIIMSREEQLEKTKKHLRSVLISEKGGVALDRLERDYKELVRVDSYSYIKGIRRRRAVYCII